MCEHFSLVAFQIAVGVHQRCHSSIFTESTPTQQMGKLEFGREYRMGEIGVSVILCVGRAQTRGVPDLPIPRLIHVWIGN